MCICSWLMNALSSSVAERTWPGSKTERDLDKEPKMYTFGYAIELPGRKSSIWGSKRPPPTAKPIGEKVEGFVFQKVFAVGGGLLDPQIRRSPARKIYCSA